MKKNICIAFYIGDYTRSGGTERVCITVANELSKKSGLSVFLIATNNHEDRPFFEVNQNVQFIHLNIDNYNTQFIKLFVNLKKELKHNNIDVVVAVEVMSLLFVLPALLVGKKEGQKYKLIVWEHFNYTVNLGKPLRDKCRKWAARYADYIVVLTKRDVELWGRNLKIRNKIISINNISPFSVSKEKYQYISRNIIAVGRLSYQKGFDRLIDIWALYLRTYPEHENWKLQIIGSGPDKNVLINKIKEVGLSDNIEMIENTLNITSYYDRAAFLAMSSRFEGLPMTLIEAQSFGLPIIAYDCLTGPAEVVTKYSGFLINNDDKYEFVKSLNTLISDTQLRIRMSEAAKDEVLRFSNDNVVEKWLELLDNI